MNLSGPFIRRPVMTVLVMLGILLFGTMAYRRLPVSDLPNVDFPTIQVTASLPGASPETMASAVATPLEREFTTIAGLESMSSSSILGSTQVTLQFDLARQLDSAAQDVQAAIAKVSPQLPRDMPAPPSYRKVNPADQPILYLALTSPTLPLPVLDEYGETMLAQRISTVSGVAQVVVYGSQKYAVRVRLDPDALSSRGLTVNDVATAIASANVNLPSGDLQGAHSAFTIETAGQLVNASAYEPVIVAWRDGAPIRVRDIGTVVDGVENDRTAAWYVDPSSERRAIVLAIQRQPGTNTVEVARQVRALLPTFRQALPGSVDLEVLFDRSESIQHSVNDVKLTLLLTLGLVVLVIFLFLRNLSATIIPSLALPMSVVGTFSVMYLMGFSLDNLSLMGLTLSVGFVVDDAIVMLENVVRHLEMGKKPLQAALDGSREVSFTILSMTLSLSAVFIPVVFMGGLIGRLFNEFAITVGAAILVSGVVSLTLIPLLGSRFLRPSREAHHGRVYAVTERAFDAMLHLYDVTLARALRHRGWILAFSAVILVVTGWLFTIVPRGFLPDQDTGQVFAYTEAAQGISFESMVAHQRAVNAVLQKDPAVARFFSSCGSRGFTGSNQGIVFLRLVPREERPSAFAIVQRLRGALAGVVGIRAFPQIPPTIRIGGRLSKAQYQYTLQGADTTELYASAALVEQRLRDLPDLLDVTSDLQLSNPQVDVDIDRDAASSLGVTAQEIESVLYGAYGSRHVSTIYAPNNQYEVIVELDPAHQRDPEALSRLYVRSSTGALVPLSAVTRRSTGVGPLAVAHQGQLPAVTVSFNLKPGVSLGQAVDEVGTVAREVLPPTITTSFQGQAQAFQSSLQGLGLLLLMAVLVIYLVLGILYESFAHPITILSALPFAGFGALVTLLIFKVDLSIYAFVGIIMLVGLVKKNGIMMVDFAIEARRHEGRSPVDAIHHASVVRFRPIMMTTMAALAGTLPIALGLGAGAEARRPLGLAVVGGLVFSQLLTLYVTPVVYVYVEEISDALRRRLSRGAEADAAPDAPAA